MDEIEKAFRQTTRLVLGEELSGLVEYGKWLERHIEGRVVRKKSAVSDNWVHLPAVEFFDGMGSSVVTLEESLLLGERKLAHGEVEALNVRNASKMLSKISTSTPEIIFGKNIGSLECACYGPTQHCYKASFCWFSDRVAYSYWPRTSENLFGCSNVVDCKYCINCYSSTKLVRCFEVSDSNGCADCYFSHNVENCENCMFCFNAKSLHYAIANKEVGKERYMQARKIVLEEIAKKLEKEKKLELDIYNIGKMG